MVDLAERTTTESEARSFTTEQMADLIGATPQQRMVLDFARSWNSIPGREQQEAVFVLAQALAVDRKRAVDLHRHVGARIRERRWMLGLTMEQLGALTGVSDSQVWRYETGLTRTAPRRLYNMAQALGVDISYFFEGLHVPNRASRASTQERILLELARNFSNIVRRKQREEVLALTLALAGYPDGPAEVRVNSPGNPKLAAPVKFIIKLMEVWDISDSETAKLLGFEDEADFRDLISGVRQLDTRDAKDRVRHLLRMREALHSLFGNINAEREWLREPRSELNHESPMDLLLEGSMENFLVVSQFVQWMAGR